MRPQIDVGTSSEEYCINHNCDLRKIKCGCEIITINHVGYSY